MKITNAHHRRLSALTGVILVLGAFNSMAAEPVLITVEKPTPLTIAMRTNDALLDAKRGGIAIRYEIEHFRGMMAIACFNDFWISLRPANDEETEGVVHFIYKGTPVKAVASAQVPAGTITCTVNYDGPRVSCFVNGVPVPGHIDIANPLAGATLRTLADRGTTQITVRDVALMGAPFSEADMLALARPNATWKPLPGMTLLASDIAAAPAGALRARVLDGIIAPETYHDYLVKSRPSQTLYVDGNHPAANDANPGNSPAHPLKTVGAAIAKLEPNTTVWIRKGRYPESLHISRSGLGLHAPITISGYPGEENEVILTGADRVVGWEAMGNGLWRKRDWPVQWYDWGKGHPGWESGKPPYSPVKRWRRSWMEHLFLDGQDLFHAEDHATLVPMSFTVDKENRICYLKLTDGVDPNTQVLEASRRGTGAVVAADFVVLRGMVLEKYLDTGLSSRGSRCRFEHLTTRHNLDGMVFNGLHNIAKNVRAIYNGQTGFSGMPSHLLIEDAEVIGNNTKGITWSYHAGGLKMTQAQSVVLRRVRSSFNAGPGLWFDVNNADITVEECTVIGNIGAGIFMEISEGPCLIRNNLAMHNPTGIVIAETDDCTVVNNTCVRNERGFAVRYSDRKGRDQERKANAGNTPPQRLPVDRQEAQGAYTLRNLIVRNNVFAFNTGTQLDVSSFTADTWRDAHKNNYQSDHNLLWSGPGKASLISWQSGAVHDLAAWPEHTHWEQHSVVADPTFLAEGPYDFRLLPSSPAAQAGAKPAVPFPDRFGRQQLLPSAGAIQPVLHTPWASRTLKGKGETHIWPLPN